MMARKPKRGWSPTRDARRAATHRHPVSEDHADRTWRPEDKCPDYAMNVVLEVLLERGRSYQRDIADEVAAKLDLNAGTAASYTSGALLYFREAGWVRCVEVEGGKLPVWEVVE